MILESAYLTVRAGQETEFESAIRQARPLIVASKGFRNIEVRRSIETPNRYLLLVTWDTVEDHTEGFRQSDRYPEWRGLLHRFYDPPPLVEHFTASIV